MRSIALLPLAATAALAALIAGCSLHHEPGVYDLTADDAFARLQQADIGALTDSRGCGLPLQIGIQAKAPQSVRWVVKANGAELASFSVRLKSAGPSKTLAVVDFAGDPAVPQTLTTPSGAPALRQPLQGAVVEFVDAALNDRSFDASRTGDSRTFDQACTRSHPAQSAARDDPRPEQPPVVWGQPSSTMGQPNPWGFDNSSQGGNNSSGSGTSSGALANAMPGDPQPARSEEPDALHHPLPQG